MEIINHRWLLNLIPPGGGPPALRTTKIMPPSECVGKQPHSALGAHTSGIVLKHVLGADAIWWLGKAELLYKEAGAKAPASLSSH